MTTRYRIIALLILAVFYAVYFGKMLLQKKHGIVTDQIGKDKSDKRRYRTELIMKIATFVVVLADLISIISGYSLFRYSYKIPGMIVGIMGDAFFIAAIAAMGSSWRAGVAACEHRKFVNSGIFRISRNPAFLGFDLVYTGILLMFFNWFLLVFTLFAVVMLHLQMLQEEKYLASEFGDEYKQYKKKVCRYFGLKSWKFFITIVLAVVATGIPVINVLNGQMKALPQMSFDECIAYTTKGNCDAVITVGYYKDGQMSYKVYGENGKELPAELHTYEIGSLTKTITASLIRRAEAEGKLNINDTIDKYLELPAGKSYPTIESLLTHTSGYAPHYLNLSMMYNGVIGGAPFRFVTQEQILKEAEKNVPALGTYEWNYSNFGYALLGMVLESVYDEYYVAIVNGYLQELGMNDSAFRKEQGDLGKCWKWEMRDAYASAGAVRSNIEDMLRYAALQLNDASFAKNHEALIQANVVNESYKALGINIDEVGSAWIIDNENGFIWHNGGTDDYNSYLGFCPETDTAVVVLSNLPSEYRIPATVLGAKALMEIQ